MSDEKTAELLNSIGQHAADVIGHKPEDVFVFVTAGDAWCGVSIYENQSDEVVYYEPSDEIFDVAMDLWNLSDRDRKWFMIHYDIKDGRFEAKYFYPDEFGFSFDDPIIDPDDDDYDPEKLDVMSDSFEDNALAERYGDKPVRYPPPDDDFYELTEDYLKSGRRAADPPAES